MSEHIITQQNFEKEVINSEKTVLLDFWATWCGPCRMISPVISRVAEECGNEVEVGKVNVDEQVTLAEKFNISAIPTLVVMKNGKVVNKAVGFQTKEQIMAMIR